MGLSRGRSLAWAEAVNTIQSVTTLSYGDFVNKMKRVFDHPDHHGNAVKRLLNLHQGSRSVADFSVEFRTLAADSKWNNEALRGAFLNGLNEQLKDERASRNEPNWLPVMTDSVVSFAIIIYNRPHKQLSSHPSSPPPTQTGTQAPPTPLTSSILSEVELGRARLSPAEQQGKSW